MRSLLGFLFSAGSLFASPGVHLDKVDPSLFPTVRLEWSENEVFPGADSALPGRTFLEEQANQILPVIAPQVSEISADSGQISFILLLDSTKSLKPKTFAAQKDYAIALTDLFSHADEIAIYSIGESPKLLTPFTSKTEAQKVIEKLTRSGKRTKIKDSIFSALTAARENGRKGKPTRIVVFTDGKEEKSKLSEDDLSLLSGYHTDPRIPIDVILFGSKPNDMLERVTIRTGGSYHTSKTEPKQISDLIHHLPYRRFAILYTSPFKNNSSRSLLLQTEQGRTEILSTYTPIVKQAEKFSLDALLKDTKAITILLISAIGFLLLVGILILWLWLRSKQREKLYDEPAETVNIPKEDSKPYDDRAIQYRRDYFYKILQLAIREGKSYKKGMLILKNADPPKEYDLYLDVTVLGRGRWAVIPLRDPTVGEIHAKIKRAEGRFIIYDLASPTGVIINGKKILRPKPLFDGDEIRVGRSVFLFRGKSS